MPFIFLNVGDQGSGKSAKDSRTAIRLINKYYITEKKYPSIEKRIFLSNQKFTEPIEKKELFYKTSYDINKKQWNYVLDPLGNKIVNNPNGHLFYFNTIYDLLYCCRPNCYRGTSLHPLHNADIHIDEIADHLDREKWKDTPDAFKQALSHARKRRNRWLCNTQKWEMVSIDFRRQCHKVSWLIKVAGTRDIGVDKPDPKYPFVLQLERVFRPIDIENEKDPERLEMKQQAMHLHLYTKKDFKIFDTSFELPPTEYNLMTEMKFQCTEGSKCSDPTGKWHIQHKRL